MLVYGGFLDNSACILLRLGGGSKILWPSGSSVLLVQWWYYLYKYKYFQLTACSSCTSNTSSSSSVVAIIQRLRVQIRGQAGAASWALGGGQEVFSGQRWSRSLSFGRVLSPKSLGLADAGSSAN